MTLQFTNKRLKKIVNVYQLEYKNVCASGLGDFLRGSICLIQICKNLGLEFDVDFKNHPMSKFIMIDSSNANEQPDNSEQLVKYKNIYHFSDLNLLNKTPLEFYKKFIKHLNSVNVDTYYLLNTSFPVWGNLTFMGRTFMKSKIRPTNVMQQYVDFTLDKIQLKPKNYNVIHIRTGDDYLIDKQNLDLVMVNKIERLLRKNINVNEKYLLVSDNNQLKLYLKRRFPRIVVYFKEITHLAISNDKTYESVKNTMLDFFLIGQAKTINAISMYGWGSGFSEWCSVIYNIPYKKILI